MEPFNELIPISTLHTFQHDQPSMPGIPRRASAMYMADNRRGSMYVAFRCTEVVQTTNAVCTNCKLAVILLQWAEICHYPVAETFGVSL